MNKYGKSALMKLVLHEIFDCCTFTLGQPFKRHFMKIMMAIPRDKFFIREYNGN